jgi:hypothetical protein
LDVLSQEFFSRRLEGGLCGRHEKANRYEFNPVNNMASVDGIARLHVSPLAQEAYVNQVAQRIPVALALMVQAEFLGGAITYIERRHPNSELGSGALWAQIGKLQMMINNVLEGFRCAELDMTGIQNYEVWCSRWKKCEPKSKPPLVLFSAIYTSIRRFVSFFIFEFRRILAPDFCLSEKRFVFIFRRT